MCLPNSTGMNYVFKFKFSDMLEMIAVAFVWANPMIAIHTASDLTHNCPSD